ncbi:MAG: EamA family transporter [Leptospirillum sp.]
MSISVQLLWGLGRAIVAAGIASVFFWVGKAPSPAGRQWLRLGATSLGVVIGFPLLSTWALESVPSTHGAVIVGTLPLATALFGAWLAGERPNLIFWRATISKSGENYSSFSREMR